MLRARGNMSPKTWELWGCAASWTQPGRRGCSGASGHFTLGPEHNRIHWQQWGMLLSSVPASSLFELVLDCCKHITSVQSLLFCKPFLAHQVMVLSVKELLSRVYPYPALSASLSSASIPPFHIYCCCLPVFLGFLSYQPFCAWKLPDLIKASVCCVLDHNLLLYFLKPPMWLGLDFPFGLPSSSFLLLFSSY